ncbi:SDR family NAD(P)-dependent oxidoreductase [Pyxidicoccus caerfyrddinensis]|uniref:SDR family NAD(P)-dependent oxidoreductase n=1 Tax=Pyxidicoccus caerfyrddinensis TaxID=2709663 RepID=UPI0013D95E0D|nr:SDR family oxidoreductase [Pyxidicoccus caerfyrddinensis]
MTAPNPRPSSVLSPGHRALITGASGGIGESFARLLAARGLDLVLVARSEGKLRALATELSAAHGIRAEVLATDLSRPDAPRQLHAACEARGLPVDLLINNAGFGSLGPFDANPFEREHEQVMLNVTALMDLTHLFLPAMLARGTGGIINVASIAGYQPVPYMAVYAATKAFVLSFTEALWGETRERGVRVLALCPGPVETGFFEVVGTRDAAVGPMATPEAVAAEGLRALEQGRASVIPGWRNRIQSSLPRIFSRTLILRVAARMMKPRPPATPTLAPGAAPARR